MDQCHEDNQKSSICFYRDLLQDLKRHAKICNILNSIPLISCIPNFSNLQDLDLGK